MGVHGLWQLISSTGKPVPLESLEGKVLAVDVSVWLHQLSKGMRDGAGNPVPNAHLHGLFTRICKLLHCRVKPIFVFDGGVPNLKKQTLANRKSRREDAEKSSELMQQKILTNLIRSQILQAAAGDASGPVGPYYTKPKSKTDKDTMFQLPPIPETAKSFLNANFHQEETFIERRELQAIVEEEYEDLNDIDVESEEFKSLPPQIQHEIIYDIQQNRKNYNMSKIAELPSDSNDFSSYQMSKLLKHSKLHNRLEDVRKEMNNRQTQELSKNYNHNLSGADVHSKRLVSDETSHVLLIKGLKNKQKNPEEEERKKIHEMEKRKKNMKLLARKLPGLSEEVCNSDEEEVCNSDELLQDSENEDLKHLDFLKVDQKEYSERLVSNNKIIDEDVNVSENRGVNSERVVIGENQMRDKSQIEEKIKLGRNNILRKNDNKPRFRPVIEVETDSSEDEDDIDVHKTTKVSMIPDRYSKVETVIIDNDDSEDEEMQLAIALSLQQDTGHPIVYKDAGSSSQDFEAKHSTSRKSMHNSSENERTMLSKDKSYEKEQTSNSCKERSEFVTLETNTSKTNQEKPCKGVKRKLSSSQPHSENLETLIKSQSGACIFKRQISNLSNEDIYEDPVPIKIIFTESEESGGISDYDVDSIEDNAERVSDVSDVSEDGFIEVKFDPGRAKEDELFPSSMFDVAGELEDKNDCERSDEESMDSSPDVHPRVKVREAINQNSRDDNETKQNETSMGSPVKNSVNVFNEEPFQKQEKTGVEDNVDNTDISMNSVSPTQFNNDMEETNEESCLTLSQESVVSSQDSQLYAVSTNSHLVSESGKGVNDNPGSPKVPDLVKNYKAMEENITADSSWRMTLKNLGKTQTQWNIRGMRAGLAKEGKELQKERGRQERLAMSITDQMHTEAQELLQLFGIPYIVSPTEAEAQCAQLDSSKMTHGTITDDSDIWLFGGKCVYKNFFNQQKYVECFKIESIQNKLGLNRQSLINIALLCGSDYTDGIQGVGPVTAMEILAEFPGHGIEGLTNFRLWWKNAQTDIKTRTVNKLRSKLRDLELKEGFPQPNVVDAYLNPTVDDSSEKFTWGIPDLDLLRQFALDKLGWTKVKVEETLQPVLKRLNDKQNQMRISAYFQPEIHIQPAKVKSKRLQNVVTKFLNPDAERKEEEEIKALDKSIARSIKQKGTRKRTKKKDEKEADIQIETISVVDKERENVTTDIDKLNTKGGSQIIKTSQSGKNVSESKRSFRTTKKQRKSSSDESSDSATSFDSSSDCEGSESEDDIVEASLDVSEILGLKMGKTCKEIENIDTKESVFFVPQKKQRVFVSGLNLDELMKLESGENDHSLFEEKENAIEKWDTDLNVKGDIIDNTKETDKRNTDSIISDDEEDYVNAGGFFKDESESEAETEDNLIINKTKNKMTTEYRTEGNIESSSGKRKFTEVDTAIKENKHRPRSEKTGKMVPAAVNESFTEVHTRRSKRNKTEHIVAIKDNSDTIKGLTATRSGKVLRGKSKTLKVFETEKQASYDITDTTQGVEDYVADVKDEPHDIKKDLPLYVSNPIKKLITGVPWEKRAAKRGRSKKVTGKGKTRQVEPKEKYQKKIGSSKVSRNPFGIVNLSESSSDSE